MRKMITDNDLKSYIKGYLEDRKISYTRLDKHDRAIEVLINENKKLKKTINKAIEYIHNHQLVFELSSKKQISVWFNMFYDELLNILKGSDKE